MSKYYIAGKYTAKERLREQRDEMVRRGHFITSGWLDHDKVEAEVSEEELLEEANKDLQDVLSSDVLIIDTFDESVTGGREVEMGFAFGYYIPVVVIGPIRNIFHHRAHEHYTSWEEFYENHGTRAD